MSRPRYSTLFSTNHRANGPRLAYGSKHISMKIFAVQVSNCVVHKITPPPSPLQKESSHGVVNTILLSAGRWWWRQHFPRLGIITPPSPSLPLNNRKLLLPLPKLFLLIFTPEQPDDIERIDQGNKEIPFIHPSRSHALRASISSQKDFNRVWQKHHRMHDIEHDGIDNHESAVEDVKEGFVRVDVAVHALEYFNHTVYIA